jgi:hypothetical protein
MGWRVDGGREGRVEGEEEGVRLLVFFSTPRPIDFISSPVVSTIDWSDEQ